MLRLGLEAGGPGGRGGGEVSTGTTETTTGLLFRGVESSLFPTLGGREFIKSAGEEYQVVKRGREYYGCGEKYNVDKFGKGKQYHLSYNIEAVGKNIKWGRGQKFRERKLRF